MQWYEDDPLYLAWDKRDSEENSLKLEIDAERRALLLLNEWDIFDEKAQERSDKYIRTLKGENDANV